MRQRPSQVVPYLLDIFKDAKFFKATARQQVDEAFRNLERDGKGFWGMNGCFTRRRTALDSFLTYDYDAARERHDASR